MTDVPGPVALLLDDGDLSSEATRCAFSAAERAGASITVVRMLTPGYPWASADTRIAETAQQEQLDIALADWQDRFPHTPIAVEIRGDSVSDAVLALSAHCSLLVVPAGTPTAQTAVEHATCPVIVVPSPAQADGRAVAAILRYPERYFDAARRHETVAVARQMDHDRARTHGRNG